MTSLNVEVSRSSAGCLDVSWKDVSQCFFYYRPPLSSDNAAIVTISHQQRPSPWSGVLAATSTDNRHLNCSETQWIVFTPTGKTSLRVDTSHAMGEMNACTEQMKFDVVSCNFELQPSLESYTVVRSGSATFENPPQASEAAAAEAANESDVVRYMRRLGLTSSTTASYAGEHGTDSYAVPLRNRTTLFSSVFGGELQVTIEREKHDRATIIWNYWKIPDKWLVMVTCQNTSGLFSLDSSNTGNVYVVDGTVKRMDLPKTLTARAKYKVTVLGLQKAATLSYVTVNQVPRSYGVIARCSTEFLAVMSKAEMQQLHKLAVRNSSIYSTNRCKVLYRNKSPSYFDDVINNHGGIMKPYIKDNSGDQLSPINGQINGLFFMAEVHPGTDGEPYYASAFGTTRLIVPVDVLLNIAPNLYFCDFYCMKGVSHYVTLVLTKPGSKQDQFCAEYLLPLSVNDRVNNPFFFRDTDGTMKVSSSNKVEVFFTEDVNIPYLTTHLGATVIQNVPLIGKGHTTPGGIPKRAGCTTCNLGSKPDFSLLQPRRRTLTDYASDYFDLE